MTHNAAGVRCRIDLRIVLAGGYGSDKQRLALACLGRNHDTVYGPATEATTSRRSATVVVDNKRVEIVDSTPIHVRPNGTVNVDGEAFELLASAIADASDNHVCVVVCVRGDEQHMVRPNLFIDELRLALGATPVVACIAVIGTGANLTPAFAMDILAHNTVVHMDALRCGCAGRIVRWALETTAGQKTPTQ